MIKAESLRRNPNRIKVGQSVRTTKAFREKMGKHLVGKVTAILRTAKEDLVTVDIQHRDGTVRGGTMSVHFLTQRKETKIA